MTELVPYPEYKDSGVEWLGEVPKDWQLEPLGKHFVERKTTVSDADYLPLSVTRSGIVPQLDDVAKTENGDARRLVKAGDFAINSRSDRKGSAGVADRDGSVSVITTVVTPRQMDPRFVHHLLRSVPFQEEYYRFGSGIVADLWSTRWPAMKGIRLAVPSAAEQSTVARFLDRETAEIDAFIADQEELIGLLTERRAATIAHAVTKGLDPCAPMKDSGIAWLGEIPTHWIIAQFKQKTELVLGKMLQPTATADTQVLHRYMRAANVQPDGFLDLTSSKEMWFSPQEIRRLSLRRGDAVVVEGGVGGFGRAAFIREDLTDWAFQNSIIRLRAHSGCDGRFVAYALAHLRQAGYIEMVANVSSMPHFTQEKAATTRVAWPGASEQVAIADYLDRATAEIDATMADARQAIALSKERRAALISAAVTGKIDLRGLA